MVKSQLARFCWSEWPKEDNAPEHGPETDRKNETVDEGLCLTCICIYTYQHLSSNKAAYDGQSIYIYV